MNQDSNIVRGMFIALGIEVACVELCYVVYVTAMLLKQWVQ